MPDREDRLLELAIALADGKPVDWDAAESSAPTESERLQIRHLREVRGLAGTSASVGDGRPTHGVHESLLHPDGVEGTPDNATPRMWGPLQVIEKIGRGQFGDVYRASDPRLDRDVALKLLRRRGDSDQIESTVIQEGRLLAKVRHPGVVTVYGAERIDGRVGLWMELLQGETLAEELARRGPFAEGEVIEAGLEICRALAAVHRAGLLHRDVKAQNVMRDADGRLVLMDFGTGRELEAIPEIDLAGTPLYLAPELLRGERATVASDIYSAGVLLFHLATGEFPVKGKTLREIRAAHTGAPAAAALHETRLSAPVREVLRRALAQDPAARFSRVDELAAALEPLARPPVEKPRPSNRHAKWIAGVAVLSVTAVAGWLADPDRRTQVIERFLRSPGPIERVVWTGSDTPADAAFSPDGRSIVYVEQDKGNLVLREIATGRTRPITTDADWKSDTGSWAERPVFSRDGKEIAYSWFVIVQDDGYWELRTIDVANGSDRRSRTLHTHRDGWFGADDWSPDGSRIAVQMRVADSSARIGWVDVVSGALTVVTAADWRMSRLLAWSPDGEFMAFDMAPTPQSATADVFVVNAKTMKIGPVVTGPASETVAGWSPSGELLFLTEGQGRSNVWLQKLNAGEPVGSAQLVRSSLRGGLLRPSVTGDFSILLMTNPQKIHSASVDFTTGQGRRKASPAASGLTPRERLPKWSRSGNHFAYLSSASEQALSHRILSIEATAEAQPRVLPLKFAQLWTYDWSPDGRAMLARAQSFQGKPGIYLIDTQTGQVRSLMDWGPDERQFLPMWADDGKSFYYTKARPGAGAFVLRDLEGRWEKTLFLYQQLRWPTGSTIPETRDSTISPDRQYVVCYTVAPESILWLISLKDRSVRELYRVKQGNAFVHNALDWTPDSNGVVVNQQAEVDRALWYVPLAGTPRKLDVGDVRVRADAIAIHPDGSQIGFVAGDPRSFEILRLDRVLGNK